jgi:hypothetical protein
LPAPPHVIREGLVLAYGQDFLYLQVTSHRQCGHPDPVKLIVGFDIQDCQDAPLSADLVKV